MKMQTTNFAGFSWVTYRQYWHQMLMALNVMWRCFCSYKPFSAELPVQSIFYGVDEDFIRAGMFPMKYAKKNCNEIYYKLRI